MKFKVWMHKLLGWHYMANGRRINNKLWRIKLHYSPDLVGIPCFICNKTIKKPSHNNLLK